MKFKTIILSLVTAGLFATPALAHSPIKQSNIEAGSHHELAPDNFAFSFGKAVGLAKITLTQVDGDEINLAYEKPKAMQKAFSVPLPKLNEGHYLITWSAVASDGHVMKGEINFVIGAEVPMPEMSGKGHKGH